MKSPPSEKPPPPPQTPESAKKKESDFVWQQQKVLKPATVLDDDEIDKQEREIIASLENEEREHIKYKERVHAMRGKLFEIDAKHSLFDFKLYL
jgi:glutamine synthetase adenylyltransferase